MQAQTTPTHTPERCAHEVMDTIPLVMRLIRKEMRSRTAPSLSVPQLRVLTFLQHGPGASLARVTEHLGVSRSTASALVDRLVRRQLVSRTVDPQERRCVVLTLTPAGAQHLRQACAATCAQLAQVLAGLSAADLRRVTEGLTLLGKACQEMVGSRRR
jgi:DNA-binding MarR family transcriptional regulator